MLGQVQICSLSNQEQPPPDFPDLTPYSTFIVSTYPLSEAKNYFPEKGKTLQLADNIQVKPVTHVTALSFERG